MVSTPVSAPKSQGGITLIRHGVPALSRKVRLSAAGYRDFWARYEEGGIIPGQAPPPGLPSVCAGAPALFSSTRRRSIESMRLIAGERPFTQDPLLVEAPLPPPRLPGFVRLNPRTWGFVSRFAWWFLNYHDGQETRAEAEARAAKVVDRLTEAAEAGEVVVVAHGFFNAVIGRELKRRGWRRTGAQGLLHWNLRRYERG